MLRTTTLATIIVLAISSTVLADSSHNKPRDRETARWLSLGGVLCSAATAGIGGVMLLYRFQGDRGYDQSYQGLQKTGEALIGIGAASTLFTPTLGEWYSGDVLTVGVKLRATGLGVGLVAAAIYYGTGSPESCFQLDNHNYCGGGSPHNTDATMVTAGIGVALYAGGVIYDLVDAPDAADRYNEHHLEVVPTVVRSPGGSTLPGVALGGTF